MAGIHDLPDVILSNVFAMVDDTRSRNSMSLVSYRWRILERQTRTTLILRGNVRDPILIPDCFRAVTNLDLSLISPWGHSLFDSSLYPELVAQKLSLSFPSVTSLTVYSRTHRTLRILASRWPNLRHVKLVRWHRRSQSSPHGTDFSPLFDSCPSLTSLDLSHFYCWIEDIPAALQAYPSVATSLTRLNLLSLSFTDGYKSQELLTISHACPKLTHFLAPCVFHPWYIDFVGDEALLTLATNCPLLNVLHLADPSTLANTRANPDADGFTQEDARISRLALEDFVSCLPLIEELILDVCFNVRDAGPALELLGSKCPRLRSLKMGQFHGICKAIESQLDGIALCGNGLEALSIKSSADLTDASLIAISRGCPRLSKFELQGCKNITEIGMKRFVGMLRQTLVDVKISCCKQLDAARSLRALEPIRDRIQRLHIDCVWDSLQQCPGLETSSVPNPNELEFDLDELVDEEPLTSNLPANFVSFLPLAKECASSSSSYISNIEETSNKKKKCRYSTDSDCYGFLTSGSGFWCKSWEKLRYLSLWIEVGELLEPLATAGLESCPVLEEIKIRVEGDCRMKSKPAPAFGLSSLARYPELVKMQLDCGDAIGYALTAPSGQMDLSLWERFYLKEIGSLNLNELDYWPPQDRDVNQRGLSLPAVGLLAQCVTLRKLFIHGTTHEHFMGFLVNIPNLRDVQLREDYYPAPENDTSTEMRVDSCSRFEAAMNRRIVPD